MNATGLSLLLLLLLSADAGGDDDLCRSIRLGGGSSITGALLADAGWRDMRCSWSSRVLTSLMTDRWLLGEVGSVKTKECAGGLCGGV